MNNLHFDYYYAHEANQFAFYRIPKVLFTDTRFKVLSCEAKVLYGLMLDRMGLSQKNKWIDANNRVFIYYTLSDVQEVMGCGHEKGVKIFAELDTVKGIGLIERQKQGMGKPARIYVKNFVSVVDSGSDDALDNRIHQFGYPEVNTSDLPKSELPVSRSNDFRKSETIKTNINHTEQNNTNLSNQSIYKPDKIDSAYQMLESADPYEVYREIIKNNIGYRIFEGNSQVDELVELMLDTICSKKKQIRIAGEDIPADVVKSRFLKLNFTHIEYVLDCLSKNTTKIYNIRNYLLTALYNSYATINNSIAVEINHNMNTD